MTIISSKLTFLKMGQALRKNNADRKEDQMELNMSKNKVHTVVLGIDDNYGSEYAFDFYVKHYHKPNNELVLVHVVEPHVYSSNQLTLNLASVREKNEEDDKVLVRNLQTKYEDKMRSNRIKGRINVIYYCRQPGKSIAEVAKDEKCGLIVLGRRYPFSGNPSNSTTLDYLLKKSNYPVSVVIKPDPVEDDANSLTSLSSAIVQPQPKRNSIMNLGILPKNRRTSCPATNIMEMAEGEPFKGNLLHNQLRALTQEQERRHSTHVTPLSSDKSEENSFENEGYEIM